MKFKIKTKTQKAYQVTIDYSDKLTTENVGETMRSILCLLTLTAISCSQLQQNSREPSSEVKPIYQGIPEVQLGLFTEWTQGLYAGEKTQDLPYQGNINELVLNAFKNAKDANEFLASLVNLKINKHYSQSSAYRKLAEGLYSVRKKIRTSVESQAKYTRQAMIILNILAEETLYTMYLNFPNQKTIRFDYAPINIDQCKTGDKKRSGKLNDIPICQGDIILSKGGAGTSSFISRIGDYPGNFSHSTIPYISPEKNEFVFIEAEIEDGVKLRTPEKDYIKDQKTKLFVYRSKNPETVKSAITSVDKLYDEIMQKVGKDDPKIKASFDYDFTMDATDSKKLFCSEVAYYAYQKSATANLDNPYPKKYWSDVKDPSKKVFLTRFLNTISSFPAPSDIELNPNYDIVAMQFNLEKFSNDRIMVALIDSLFQAIGEHSDEMEKALALLKDLGSQEVTPEDLQLKLKMIAKMGIKIPNNAAGMAKNIPAHINYNQIIFFSFLNDVLSPKVYAALTAQEKQFLAKGKILDLETMRLEVYNIVEKEMKFYLEKMTNILAK